MSDSDRWSQQATVEDVPHIRDFVGDAGRRLAASADVVFRLSLVADEICTNTILHGYGGDPGLIDVQVHAAGDGLSLIVRDEAPFFDPTTVPIADVSQPLEERDTGGMGLLLVLRLVDRMTHRDRGGGNELVVTIQDRAAG